MSLLQSVGVLGYKIEASPGTAEAITGAECKLLVIEPEFTVEPTTAEHTPIKVSHGRVQSAPGGRQCTITFQVALKGPGAAGTIPALGDLFKACEMVETNRPGILTKYLPGTLSVASQPTITLYLNNDGRYRIAKGCMGTVSVSGAGNELHIAEFEFKGVFHAEGDAVVPTPSYEQTHPDVLLQSWLHILEYNPASTGLQTVAGVEDLRQGAGANDRLAAFLPAEAANKQIGRVRLYLKRTGLPAAFTNGIWAEIWTDAAGVPNALVAGAVSQYRNPVYIRDDAYEWVDFIFETPVTKTAATDYHVVLNGDFGVGANIIDWAYYDTGVASTSSQDNAGWANLAGNNNFIVDVLTSNQVCLKLAGVEWELGNTVNLRQDVACAVEGWDRAFVADRMPMISVEPEQELIAVRDFVSYHKNRTKLFVSYRIGSSDGYMVDFIFPNCQVTGVGEQGDRDGITTAPLELAANTGIPQTSGNDEFELRFQ